MYLKLNKLKVFTFFVSFSIFSFFNINTYVAQSEIQNVGDLTLNTPITKNLKSRQKHVYQLKVEENQYFKVNVQQRGIDVVIEIFSPNNARLNRVNSFSNINSLEEILEAVKEPGIYSLEVKNEQENVPLGEYTIELKELRAMSKADEERILARQNFIAAQTIAEQQKPESYQQAIDKYLCAANFYINAGDLNRAAIIFYNVADIYLNNLKDKSKALVYYNESLGLCKKANNKYGEATVLHNIGYVFRLMNDFEKAYQYYNKALFIAKETLHDGYDQAVTIYNIAVLNDALKGNTKEAINLYRQAINLFEKEKQFNLCGIVCNKLIDIYKRENSVENQLKTYDEQKDFYLLCNDRKQVAHTISAKADAYKLLYDKDNALRNYEEALKLYKQLNDKDNECTILNNIADLYQTFGENYKALDYYKQALLVLPNQSKLRPLLFGNIGLTYSYTLDYEKSILYLNDALNGYQKLLDANPNDKELMFKLAIVKSNLATVYSNLGHDEKSLYYNVEILEVFKLLGKKNNEAITLNNLAGNYLRFNQIEKVKELYLSSLRIFKELNNKKGQAISLTKLGDMELKSANYQEAILLLNESLSLRQSILDKVGEVYTRNLLGKCFQALKNDEEALSNYKQSLVISRELSDKASELVTLYNLACFEQSRKNLLQAIDFIESAIKIIESTRAKLFNKDFQSSFFASNQKCYSLYIDLLMSLYSKSMETRYNTQAFEISEKARARTLLDLLRNINAQTYAGVSPELVKEQMELENQVSSLAEKIVKTKNRSYTKEELESLEKTYAQSKAKLEILETEIANNNPNYKHLTRPTPLTLKQIQEKVLDSNTVLLQYSLGENSSYVWVVNDKENFSYKLPKRQEIEAVSDKIYSLITARNSQEDFETVKEKMIRVKQADEDYAKLSFELSKMIIAPIEKHLTNKKRLLLCLDGKLNFVPFAALPLTTTSSFTPLVINYEVSSSPSASTISLLREQLQLKENNISKSKILVVADPIFTSQDIRISKSIRNDNQQLTEQTINLLGVRGDFKFDRLPFTRKEAEGIKTVFGGQVTELLDQNANKENIKHSDLTPYGALHFATHSITDNEHPEFSSIVLSMVDEKGQAKPGFLTTSDIFKIKTSAQVVTLSACSTALGKEKQGEGIIGLTRAFMYSGTPRVIATLWNINDEATAEFMVSFYQYLKQDMPPNTALRQAQLTALKKDKLKSPYYWGAFILQGEFK